MNIYGKTVILRAPEQADLPQLHQWANDPDLWNMLGGWRFASNSDSASAWLKDLGRDPAHQRYVITRADDGGLIGTANLVNIDMKNGNAFHGMLLGDPHLRGKGYGQDTVMAVMRYAFEQLRLERLDTDIIEYNTASQKLYLGKCGWKEEGRQRRWHFRNGRYWDRIIVGVIKADYQALIADNHYWETV